MGTDDFLRKALEQCFSIRFAPISPPEEKIIFPPLAPFSHIY